MEQLFVLIIMVCVGLALMLQEREETAATHKKSGKQAVRQQKCAASGMPYVDKKQLKNAQEYATIWT